MSPEDAPALAGPGSRLGPRPLLPVSAGRRPDSPARCEVAPAVGRPRGPLFSVTDRLTAVVSLPVSLTLSATAHLFGYLLVARTFSVEKCPFRSFAHFVN